MDKPCPTPGKSRYATEAVAEKSAKRFQAQYRDGAQQHPYRCGCGWVHLYTPKVWSAPTAEPSEELLAVIGALGEREFRSLVSEDVRERADPEQGGALRHWRIAVRWRDELAWMTRDLQAQFLERKGLQDSETRTWRAKAAFFQRGVAERLKEARLCAVGLDEPVPAPEGPGAPCVPERSVARLQAPLRAAAGERAVQRLIGLHQQQYTALLITECWQSGCEIPERIVRHAVAHGIMTAEEEGEDDPEQQALPDAEAGAGHPGVPPYGSGDREPDRDGGDLPV